MKSEPKKKTDAMYAIRPQRIPWDKRAEINEKILFSIDSGKELIPRESIYNCYTGMGGLHGLRQADYPDYNAYAEAKREAEMGQFFTPHAVCRDMAEMLAADASETILEMCCGMGNMLNFLPNPHNVYAFDSDPKAVAVARYLYPDAHVEQCDIRRYRPEQRFDAVIGNPPFNLHFGGTLSQDYYMERAGKVLNPAGLLLTIVPVSFMQSNTWEKTRIAAVDRVFSFIGQTELPANTFAQAGVGEYRTKIMAFLRRSEHIEPTAYDADEFVPAAMLKERIAGMRALKNTLRLELLRETNRIDREELEWFEYRTKKYLFELKAHEPLRKHYDKAVAIIAKVRNQQPPEGCTNAEFKVWEQNKLTPARVLAILRRYIAEQNRIPRKEVALVKTSYGFKLKGYAPRLLDSVKHRSANLYDLVTGAAELPRPTLPTSKNLLQLKAAERLISRKRLKYELQNREFRDMKPEPQLARYLDCVTFRNRDGELCRFTELQKHDLNAVMQKRYALLNWQQGSGKTAAVYHRAKYLLKTRRVRNVIVLAPAIAANMTWDRFLAVNGEEYRMVRTLHDLERVSEGMFLVVPTSLLAKLKRPLQRFIRLRSRKLALVFDESDEITNPQSQRTHHVLDLFRRLKYKILDTGTVTRNNIAELYSQLELLYNNSENMLCRCRYIYRENREHEIESKENPDFGRPFPAYRGAALFRACHSPGKVSVFGVERQNQDVYNKDELHELVAKTILTRKFRDFAGEKCEVRMHTVAPAAGEYEVYRVILEEFCRICELYYNSTGDTRKEAGLRLMRQIRLLIRACSVPQTIEGYFGDPWPTKTAGIRKLIDAIPGKVAIGCTSHAAFDLYERFIRENYPERPLFTARGDITLSRRLKIVDAFDASLDGILVCTQQSLSSSVNIPTCDDIILEALQWNLSRMEQFYFRFIRLDSERMKRVHFFTYEDSVEQNLMALVLTKERLNEFIDSGEVKEESEIFSEFGVTMSVIESLLKREADKDGKVHVSWGSQRIAG